MEAKTVRELKHGEWFTLKPIEEPKDTQVYIREDFDRSEGKYWGQKWSDISVGRFFSGDKVVYVGFTF